MIYRVIEWERPDPRLALVAVYSEIDDGLKELRKVCVFVDGTMGHADYKHCFGCGLAEGKVQTASAGPHGEHAMRKLIDKEAFEEIWTRALLSPYPEISPWIINEEYEISFEETMMRIYGP